MNSIRSGIATSSPSVQRVDPGKLQNFESIAPFDADKLEILSPKQINMLREILENSHQTTVIERNGQVIASFGENGWKHFQNNSDFDASFAHLTDTQIIEKLKQKYGDELTVRRYPIGHRPTFADVLKQIHGNQPGLFSART